MSSKSRVTVYSNGIADFQREFALKGKDEPVEINIPVNREHIGDFIGTLSVFGKNVELVAPPSYRPENENDSRINLEAVNEVYRQLLRQLTGSKIKFTEGANQEWKRGRIIGIDTEEKASQGEAVTIYRLAYYGEEGIATVPVTQITKLEFEEEEICREVDKALKRSAEQIRPNSSQVNLSLQGDAAVLQYALPCAAWKLSYRLRQVKDLYEFEAMAHVDNNTEEDWTDTIVAVCTGNPHTFETDLAEAKTPQRNRVNVVSERAEGGQTVRRAAKMATKGGGMAMGYSADESVVRSDAFASPNAGFEACVLEAASTAGAAAEQIQAEEIGDFTRFQCKEPISISAGNSATFPVFTTALADAESVLYFNGTNPERAFRAIKFKNETEHTFNKGVCSFFQEGAYSGQSVLSAVKPGEEQFAIYATDTTAKFLVKGGQSKQQGTALRIADGVVYTTLSNERNVEYNISATEPAKVVIDYVTAYGDETTVTAKVGNEEIKPTAKTDTGFRFEFDVTQGDQVFSLEEKAIVVQQVQIGNINQVRNNVIVREGKIKDDGLQVVFDIQADLDQTNRQIAEQQRIIDVSNESQENLRANCEADPENGTYRTLLEKAFNEQQDAQKEKAGLETQQDELQQKLQSALMELKLDWKE